MMTRFLGLCAAIALLGGAGCKRAGDVAGGATAGEVDMESAKTIFSQRCEACHGKSGKGDGPGAAALNPKPRNYTDAKWQASVTDEQLAKTILQGGAAVGKSPLMPPNPDLKDKPAVINGLVKVVRAFSGK